MFTAVDKALVALVMAGVYVLNHFFGVSWGLSEATVTSIVAFVTPILVYLFPNKAA